MFKILDIEKISLAHDDICAEDVAEVGAEISDAFQHIGKHQTGISIIQATVSVFKNGHFISANICRHLVQILVMHFCFVFRICVH